MTLQNQERERLENLHKESLIMLKIIHFSTFKKMFEILAVSCGNVSLVFTKDSLLMNTLNEMQKYIIHLNLNCREKMIYHFNQQTVLYLNCKEFYNDALIHKDKKSILYLYVLKETPTNFNLTFLSGEGECSSSFVFRSLSENMVKKYSFPKFQFSVSCTMKSQLFHRLIGERKKTDVFELLMKGKTIQFISESKLSCKRHDILFESNKSVLFTNNKENINSELWTDGLQNTDPDIFDSERPFSFGTFSCRKINNFYKLPSISEHVTLHLNCDKPDSPLTCEYHIGGNLGKLFLFFATEKKKSISPNLPLFKTLPLFNNEDTDEKIF